MFLTDGPNNTTTRPTPSAVGIQGWFQSGNPALGQAGTVITTDWCNAVQDEIGTLATANGAALSKANSQQALAALNGRGVGGMRNRLLNPMMEISQRGTTFSSPASGSYTLDRWLVSYDGTGGAFTISQITGNLAETAAAEESLNWLRVNRTSAATGQTTFSIGQRIEGARTMAGRVVAWSFYAKAGSSIVLPAVQVTQNFGTGGSPSASVTTFARTNVAIGTTLTRYSGTFTIPSINSATLGTNGNDYLEFAIRFPVTGTWVADITGVQIEPGATATALERRPLPVELFACRRYYQQLTHNVQSPATGSIGVPYQFQPPMRATPSATNVQTGTLTGATLTTETPSNPRGGLFQVDCAANGFITDRITAYSAEL